MNMPLSNIASADSSSNPLQDSFMGEFEHIISHLDSNYSLINRFHVVARPTGRY